MRNLLAALLLVVLFAGCGADEPARPSASTPAATPTAAATDPESEAVAAALQRYAAAVRAGDERMICTQLLSRSVLERVKTAGGDCERDLIADAVADGGPSYRIVVESVEINGTRATARTRATERDGPRTEDQPLVREAGRWKLSI